MSFNTHFVKLNTNGSALGNLGKAKLSLFLLMTLCMKIRMKNIMKNIVGSFLMVV